jgi:GTPase SAR1 family protein
LRWQASKTRQLKRPYMVKDFEGTREVENPEEELGRVVSWLQDTIVRPIDVRLPGQPFQHDLLVFPFVPSVLVCGNHSAGKSTFINELLGRKMQETGVAPTDDGFTILERSVSQFDEVDDGPTLLSCPQNRTFRELQRFGQPFWGHFRRKRLALPEDSKFPHGLQVIDTPGMIDMPIQSDQQVKGGRGYNFIEVVRWFAKRADLILLLFDPDRPGTTGESLDVLTRSLAGLDHKFVIVLNKVDQLDSSVDFARAYGTLGWALSKVVPRKDIPLIYTMYNEGVDSQAHHRREHKLPLDAFRKKRREVVAEVLRSRQRHWDNIITSTDDMLRQLQMVAKVSSAVRSCVRVKRNNTMLCGAVLVGAPAAALAKLFYDRLVQSHWGISAGLAAAFALVSCGVSRLLREYCAQFERLELEELDRYFEESYAWYFIHVDAEDLRVRWAAVRSRVASILNAASPTVAALPEIPAWEVDRIDECLERDIWYLRLLAKRARAQSGDPVTLLNSGEISPTKKLE